MGKIVAIGGGDTSKLETLSIEKEIITLTNKKHPHVLYIPTAGGDNDSWIQVFKKMYVDSLGCTVEVLYLLKEKPTKAQIEKKVFSADIIWVGGGNTLRMMKRWRKLGVDKVLKQAYKKNIVLAGISAGSICWFSYGHSDSIRFSNPNRWNFIRVKGLGLLSAIHCPHYHSEKREKDFEKMIRKYGGIGIAINDNAALEVVDDTYRIITSKNTAKAYKVYRKGRTITVEELLPTSHFQPLPKLLSVA